ncbi:MAG: phage major tail tube protein [Planktomarina sp.]
MSLIQHPRTLRNYRAYIDGQSYAGLSPEAKMPEVKIQVADYRGGGMDGTTPQDMGIEAMTAEITLAEWTEQALTLIGTRKRMVLRPAAQGQDVGNADAIIATLGGLWSSLSPGDLKPGNDMPLKLTLSCDYFRMVKNGVEMFELAPALGKRVVGGVDQLAALNTAMGA